MSKHTRKLVGECSLEGGNFGELYAIVISHAIQILIY